MNEVVLVKIRNSYGRELNDPVNENAKAFATIAGRDTLPEWVLGIAHKMGFRIEYAEQPNKYADKQRENR